MIRTAEYFTVDFESQIVSCRCSLL